MEKGLAKAARAGPADDDDGIRAAAAAAEEEEEEAAVEAAAAVEGGAKKLRRAMKDIAFCVCIMYLLEVYVLGTRN